ncbi:MAG: hypothetical protein U0X20_17020 [Caldilineaceae bacterium]
MPQQADQGAASQADPAPTSYRVTVIEQRIYQLDVPVLDEYPTAAGAEEAYDDVLGQMHTRQPQIKFSGHVEWIRPTGGTGQWEAPVYDPSEPINEN